jgi:hypothetical protein
VRRSTVAGHRNRTVNIEYHVSNLEVLISSERGEEEAYRRIMLKRPNPFLSFAAFNLGAAICPFAPL